MSRYPLISISIATFNRCDRLMSLIRQILKCSSHDFEILVVDNCSTDDTINKLQEIDDDRIRFIRNKTNVGGNNNVMKAIFHSGGRYCFYVNDRDLVYPDKLGNLFEILSVNDFAFLHIQNDSDSGTLSRYEKGATSFLNQKLWSHPTGMVFNMDIIKKSGVTYDDFLKYSNTVYGYNFLSRYLMFEGETAILHKKIWREDDEYIQKSPSKFDELSRLDEDRLFFSYDSRYHHYQQIVGQIEELVNDNEINDEELIRMMLYANDCMLAAFVTRRMYYFYKSLSSHYRLRRRIIPIKEILNDFDRFNASYPAEIKGFYCNEAIISAWDIQFHKRRASYIKNMINQIPVYLLKNMRLINDF